MLELQRVHIIEGILPNSFSLSIEGKSAIAVPVDPLGNVSGKDPNTPAADQLETYSDRQRCPQERDKYPTAVKSQKQHITQKYMLMCVKTI